MTKFQNEVLALVSASGVQVNVHEGHLFDDVEIYVSRKTNGYRSLRSTLRKTYGLTPLYSRNDYFAIGDCAENVILVVNDN